MHKQNQKQVNEIVNVCLKELKHLGIYVYHRAVTTSSVYLKFKDSRLRSLTIRDHKTIPKYRYKWNVVLGYNGPKKVIDRGIARYMYNERNLDAFIEHIQYYHRKVQQSSYNK